MDASVVAHLSKGPWKGPMRLCNCATAVVLLWIAIASVQAAPQNDFFQDLPPGFDPYKILGVEKTATTSDIRKAFRRQSLRYHPDKQDEDVQLTNYQREELREKFEQISKAYEVIGDHDTRMIFDSFGGQKFENEWEYRRAKQKGRTKSADGFYSDDTDLILPIQPNDLSVGSLRKLGKPLLVEFYAPWCIHCQRLAPLYKRLALLLQDQMYFGAVNCETNKVFCERQDIDMFPLIRLFSTNGGVEDYDGEPEVEDIQRWIDEVTNSKLYQITPTVAQQEVLNSPYIWIVIFSLPQCGPCQQLTPLLRHLSSSLEKFGVKVGTLNCNQHGELCGGIPYFPYINLLPKYSASVFSSIHLHADPRENPGITVLEITKNVIEAIMSPADIHR